MNKNLKIEKTIKVGEESVVHLLEKCPFSIWQKEAEINYICIGKQIVVDKNYRTIEEITRRLEKIDIELIGAMIINYFNYLKQQEK
jgi:hypothetical protein